MSIDIPSCAKECIQGRSSCRQISCRKWIDYEEDFNCCLISIKKNNGGPLTLQEVGKRLKLSFVRIRQIEVKAIEKLSKIVLVCDYLFFSAEFYRKKIWKQFSKKSTNWKIKKFLPKIKKNEKLRYKKKSKKKIFAENIFQKWFFIFVIVLFLRTIQNIFACFLLFCKIKF